MMFVIWDLGKGVTSDQTIQNLESEDLGFTLYAQEFLLKNLGD